MNCAALRLSFILTLSCEDQAGIVAAVTTELANLGTNIAESSQHWDRASNRFFMRIAFSAPAWVSADAITKGLAPVVNRFGLSSRLLERSRRPKIVIMVSKFDHALLHLIYQIRVGWLEAEVAAIISNHEDSRETAAWAGIPYHVLPISKENKQEQEGRILAVIEDVGADLVVLARYMQVYSDDLAGRLFGKVINIHHSFLPSFKGARPYHQAFEHGVKLIGATAHYVTAQLDEGPIIEQETERVTHSMSVEDFIATGRDIESRVLARAIKRHLEARVMINGRKTVVFA
ncbi:formyltetrahydrofolate deformylase [Mesorhizobium sp. M7A.F.Ca.CA.001.09.2.1]|uniref:Formyltetrahydrofolate deformylase n=1 Tax=Mesorhizobium ciceri TaxID=39645 RepID=A0AB38THS6_9HYPH|nr:MULTISPECIES: formyltetrahydrofolate deformylase [Mesorhizobium]MDF3218155.1 formyltetrahydrofolate deformylase [Mesorhizobium ciceri]RUY67224.1 formyltetrahydrofolate deformylase [Mesorhizobium sp. M7A.F.Ca.CA.001.13.1.1]RUY70254.1 formyltetrahydrofolate deformylase [Mesorhizobium sp. M7A.F.Ca.CA.001.05.1.1]RUY72592.1 formyltetrahydrofolate deformylase [Mesorhizobium sp. M7A.F.Ca.CA.001.09.2.1]RUZ04711.1 formyltetrahydrofolate deformylase [Mesorhizobium sp. M7A.F.Ca.CA.001.04.2.1]